MNRLKEKLKDKKYYHALFVLGAALLPLIEVYRSFWGDTLQIGFIAAEEVLLLLWTGILFLAGVIFAVREKRKKALAITLVWLFLFVGYLLPHSFNAARFDASLLPGASPSFVKECYYLLRMYFAPTSLIFSAILLALPMEKALRAVRYAAWGMALFIVIPTLFGFSFCSYRDGNVLVDGSFFSWFRLPHNANFAHYTAKGLFSSANDLAAVLFGITPFVAYSALKKGRFHDHLLLALTGLSSIMVSTKIGSLGFFLALGATLFAAGIQMLLKKDRAGGKNFALALLILLLLIPLFLISPGKKLQSAREVEKENADRPTESVEEIDSVLEGDLNENNTRALSEYLKEHHWDHFVDPWFLEIYPVECDPEFWSEITSRDNHLNSDSRRFKLEMISRIRERNNRSADLLLGIGFTSGVPYAERDYLYQYHLFGAGGLVILLFPFAAAFALGVLHSLKLLFKKKDFLFIGCCTLSVFAFLATAYYAGHVLDTIYTTYFLSFACAVFVSLRTKNET